MTARLLLVLCVSVCARREDNWKNKRELEPTTILGGCSSHGLPIASTVRR